MSFKITLNDIDISDYVVSAGEVPVTARNRDCTPIADHFDLEISVKAPVEAAVGDVVKVYQVDSPLYPFFIGDVTEVKNRDETLKRLTVTHILGRLQKKYVTYDELHERLASAGDNTLYKTDSVYDAPNVQVNWLLETLCEACGIQFDTHILRQHYLVTMFEEKEVFAFSTSGTYTFYFDDLYIDENMLYALNQDYAAGHEVFDSSAEYTAKRISFFDLFAALVSAFGVTLRFRRKSTPEYIEAGVVTDQTFLVDDDYTLTLDYGTRTGNPGGYTVAAKYAIDRAVYRQASPQPITKIVEHTAGEGKQNLSPWNNFVLLLKRKDGGGEPGDVFPLSDLDPDHDGHASFKRLLRKRIQAETKDYLYKEVRAPYDLDSFGFVKSNHINLEGRTSTIRQEVSI